MPFSVISSCRGDGVLGCRRGVDDCFYPTSTPPTPSKLVIQQEMAFIFCFCAGQIVQHGRPGRARKKT